MSVVDAFDPYPYVLKARTSEQLKEAVAEFSESLGFENYAATLVIDRPTQGWESHVVHNAPAAYVAEYEAAENNGFDPVMQYLRHSSLPIAWSRENYVQGGALNMWLKQADFGYQTGIAVALHLPLGMHFAVGVDTRGELPKDLDKLRRMVAEVQLFAVHAQEAAERIFVPKGRDGLVPALTPRELEALRWTMEGKTAWEVSKILGISERTATAHITNATHKLGCANKYVASFRALRMGIIR